MSDIPFLSVGGREEEEEEDATDVFQQLEVLSSKVQRINQWKRPTYFVFCAVSVAPGGAVREPSFRRRNFDFGAVQQPPALTKKVQYTPLNMSTAK